jgi:hypothetical protein
MYEAKQNTGVDPLPSEHLAYAYRVTEVAGVSFCHGGDPPYRLIEIPRRWHEQWLRPK